MGGARGRSRWSCGGSGTGRPRYCANRRSVRLFARASRPVLPVMAGPDPANCARAPVGGMGGQGRDIVPLGRWPSAVPPWSRKKKCHRADCGERPRTAGSRAQLAPDQGATRRLRWGPGRTPLRAWGRTSDGQGALPPARHAVGGCARRYRGSGRRGAPDVRPSYRVLGRFEGRLSTLARTRFAGLVLRASYSRCANQSTDEAK